jgi:hypothetical protein
MLATTAVEAFELQHLWPRLGPAANRSWWPAMRRYKLSSPRVASPWDAAGRWRLTGCGGRHDGVGDYRRRSSTWHRAHTGHHRVEPLLLGRRQAPHHRLAPGAHRPRAPPRGGCTLQKISWSMTVNFRHGSSKFRHKMTSMTKFENVMY